ncbi:MAG: hypothetical protein J1E43_04025 [Christensenellaceae bacterium]|nr:hypothetical protein [Christensenellaceae bacterium]
MKRFLCLLLILLLPAAALAENLRGRTGAPEHIADTLTSRTGKTVITVDADVIVPDVSAVPLWEVSSTYIPAEKVFEIARLLSPDATIEQNVTFSYVDGGKDIWPELVPGDYTLSRLPVQGVTAAGLTFESDRVNGRALKSRSFYWLHDQQQVYFYVDAQVSNNRVGVFYGDANGFVRDIPGGDLPGHALTQAEAIAKADALIAVIAPGFTCRSVGSVDGWTWSESDFINDADAWEEMAPYIPSTVPKTYQLAYTREIEGIPVGWSSSFPNQFNAYESTGSPPGYEKIYVTLDDLGEIVDVYWSSPYTVGAKTAGDCELLPFEQVWSIFRETAPLSMQHQESSGDVRASVNRVELSYMPVRQPGGGYLLTPVWDFFGHNKRGATLWDYQGNAILTVDALTGQVIDRWLGY